MNWLNFSKKQNYIKNKFLRRLNSSKVPSLGGRCECCGLWWTVCAARRRFRGTSGHHQVPGGERRCKPHARRQVPMLKLAMLRHTACRYIQTNLRFGVLTFTGGVTQPYKRPWDANKSLPSSFWGNTRTKVCDA